jgi:hypothetical protein
MNNTHGPLVDLMVYIDLFRDGVIAIDVYPEMG